MNLYRGLNHQATIIATAPLVGILGAIRTIFIDGFGGSTGDPSALRLALIGCLADSLQPFAYGLALALLTTWSRNYLTQRADALLAETKPTPSTAEGPPLLP